MDVSKLSHAYSYHLKSTWPQSAVFLGQQLGISKGARREELSFSCKKKYQQMLFSY